MQRGDSSASPTPAPEESGATTESETKMILPPADDDEGQRRLEQIIADLEEMDPGDADGIPTVPRELPRLPGYEFIGELGAGGMGKVYRARQVSMDRVVAIKILPKRLARDEKYIQRFLREAKAAGRLNHPNIVQGIDVGDYQGMYYFVMEFVDGYSVERLLEQRGQIDEPTALRIIQDVALALQQAYEAGIVHRDIKPDNLFINKKGVAKLGDLGLAKSKDMDQDVTISGAVIGTPYYMSPEQARGEEDLDTRSDIYSLGVTLYHMLSGQLPFKGNTVAVTLAKHLNEEPPDIRQYAPMLSDGTLRLLRKMLAKSPEDRYQTPEELAADVKQTLSGKPITATVLTRRVENREGKQYKFSRVLTDDEVMFGLIAVKSRLINRHQLKECLDIQEDAEQNGVHEQLGNLLVERGYLSVAQVKAVLKTQTEHQREMDANSFGKLCIQAGYATSEQAQSALDEQGRLYRDDKPAVLGNIMVSMGFITHEQKNEVLRVQENARTARDELSFIRLVSSLHMAETAALNRAIQKQQKLKATGSPARLLDLIVEDGVMTRLERDVVLRAMKRMALTGQSAEDLVVEQQAGEEGRDSQRIANTDTVLFSEDDFVVMRPVATECPFCGFALKGRSLKCPKCKKLLK